jgi:adhesin transport system outer membrane protein
MLQTTPALSEDRVQAWTFEQTVRQVLATHPAILSQQSSYDAAKADLDTASWQRYPAPDLAANKQENGPSNTVLTLQQPLWTGGRITADIDGAKSRLDAAEAVLNETRRDVTLNLISAYTETLRLQARQEYAVTNVREHKKLLELVSRRVEQEVTPPVDESLAQSRLYQAMNQLSSETEALSNAMAQLSQLAGRDIEKVAPLDADTPDVPKSEKDAQQQAEDHSPTLARLAYELAAADADISSKKSVYLPQFALTYNKTSGGDVLGSLPPGHSVMLVMHLQPGSGLSSLSDVDSATAKRQAARQNRDTALRDLRVTISTGWNQLVAARLRYENATLSSKISGEVFESYVRQYTTGRKGWLDVMNSAQEAANAEMAAADASAQITSSALRLRLLTGNLRKY